MTYEQFEPQFIAKATDSGYSEYNIQKCLAYAKPLLDKGIPVIFNTSNLAALVGYRKAYLKKAALYAEYFYRTFYVKKRDKTSRRISEPLPSLKEIQTWILNEILYNLPSNNVSRFAKGYIPKRDILDNTKYHKDQDMVVSLDIKDFFPSIRRDFVERIFLNMGYSSNISNLLSKLCCSHNCLPQGAPTSPYLSNLYLSSFDAEVSEFAKSQNIKYTRYADDLTFSGEFEPKSVIEFVTVKLYGLQLRLNDAKIKIMRRNQRQIVTGIVVNDFAQAPKFVRNKIRQEVYFIKKLGLAQHLKNTNNERSHYLNHLLGKVRFVLFVNPSDKEMLEYKEYLKGLLKSSSQT